MSSINSLLNHEGALQQQRARSTSSASMHQQQDDFVATTTFEAADALTTLATLGSGQQYAPMPHAPTRELPSPTAYAHNAPRRTSSFGSYIASVEPVEPVEPSPPIEQPLVHSPTLEQYHHGSKSPEAQRRQSLLMRTSPVPILAPMQPLPPISIQEKPQQQSPVNGIDVSPTVAPPMQSSDDSPSARDDAHHREPAFVVETSTIPQTREPDPESEPRPTDSALHSIVTSLPHTHEGEPQLPSPLPFIKHEPSGTPREATPTTNATDRRLSVTIENIDADTLKAIEIAKQSDLGLRAKRNASVAESVTSPIDSKPAPAPSKKRPAPSASLVKKKGTAAPKKPASKRRKIENDTDSNLGRSATPSSRAAKSAPGKGGKKGSQAGTPAAESSPGPDRSSQAHPTDDEAESSEDSSLYCICRKPDNHRWMIGCDGGCDDWFHGSCVDMQQADEGLVDRFICPNCESVGRGQTTYKPMCRRDGCRKPAWLGSSKMSKYCSDECGVGFFQDQLQRTAGAKKSSTIKRSKKKGSKEGDDQDLIADEEEPTPLGGVLRAKDLKALVQVSKDIESFKRLGSGVLSPPQTASPTTAEFDGPPNGVAQSNPHEDLSLTAAEQMHLGALQTEKTYLNDRLEALKDREKFVSMAKEQAIRHAEKEKIKVKDFCGYDSRLSWSDSEFLGWRKGKRGRASFQFGTLSPTEAEIASVEHKVNESSRDLDGDSPMNDVSEAEAEVCTKKRCPKHPQWQKLNLQDARFEELEVVEAIRECEKEERSVRERARRRGVKDAMAADLVSADGSGNPERNRDGWVEMIQA